MPSPLTGSMVALLVASATMLTLAAPVNANPTDALGALAGGTSSETDTSTAGSSESASGSTSAPSGTLLRGCHTYSYSYDIQVPTDDWSLEISIVDRQGKGVAAEAFFGPAHPTSATSSFRLCHRATVPGKFRIRTTLDWYDDPDTPHRAAVPVSRFRLARP